MNPLEAGRELDALVAEKVMGWTEVEREGRVSDPDADVWAGRNPSCHWGAIPGYSNLISAAWLVVEKMRKQHRAALHLRANRHEIPPAGEENSATFWSDELHVYAYASTVPLAICRAALLAVSARSGEPSVLGGEHV